MTNKTKQKILIVDDELFLSEMYEEKFKNAGFEVLIAHNGKDALTVMKKKKPDIILLDILMPQLNGFETLKEMKKGKEYRDIPVILLTNLGETKIDMDQELSNALGVKDYLIKTKHTPDEVLGLVKKTLNI